MGEGVVWGCGCGRDSEGKEMVVVEKMRFGMASIVFVERKELG